MSTVTDSQLIDFVYQEADLIDAQQLNEWEALFSDDGHYWMPLTHGQTDPILQGSLMYEDKLLLKIRVERFFGKRTFSQQPHTRSHHLLQERPGRWHERNRRAPFHQVLDFKNIEQRR